ncbi:DUF1819 family protein [Xenorhabdus doucetiae]|uniref:Inner membrane protein DUF1819 n=1 Tax=Xenorhabdus doucetiae TaxID=351671 RepID=A0A068QMP3_9GAMM|nr:DUF1819 family protein [Xenorhabdus doucetiae]TYP01954.1 putative inner membrane protein DUF1819 [Xenorhabdus doucetiae]CDG15741.1 conserved protein of unknown function [Xenorhabdus doucetiae]
MKYDKTWIGDLLGGSLMSRESRLIAELMLQSPNEEEWQNYLVVENILQASSDKTAIRYSRTLRLRLSMLDSKGLELIAFGSERERNQCLIVALMLQSPVVEVFISLVVNDAKRQFRESLPMNAWETFVEDQSSVHPELKNFSESSLKKMGNNTIKALSEVGYIDTPRRRNLQTVYLLPEVQDLLARIERNDLVPLMEGKQ